MSAGVDPVRSVFPQGQIGDSELCLRPLPRSSLAPLSTELPTDPAPRAVPLDWRRPLLAAGEGQSPSVRPFRDGGRDRRVCLSLCSISIVAIDWKGKFLR